MVSRENSAATLDHRWVHCLDLQRRDIRNDPECQIRMPVGDNGLVLYVLYFLMVNDWA